MFLYLEYIVETLRSFLEKACTNKTIIDSLVKDDSQEGRQFAAIVGFIDSSGVLVSDSDLDVLCGKYLIKIPITL